MSFIRLVVVGFVILSVIFFSVSLYSRSVRREKLENEWDRDPPKDAGENGRETFIEQGLERYNSGFRKKLILLIYVLPPALVGSILYFTNY